MSARRQATRQLPEHAIFGDEEAARMRAELDELRDLVGDLAQRVQSQFTTISAHAEIARQQAEFVREEGRVDLERTRGLLVGLIEQALREAESRQLTAVATAPPTADDRCAARLATVEDRLAGVISSVERCFDRQRVLAETIEALFDSVLSERRGEPVAALSLV